MNLRKKGIAILLIAVILSSLIPNLVSYAAEPNFTLTDHTTGATTATAEVGKTVEVDVKYTNGMDNEKTLAIVLDYNPTELEPIADDFEIDENIKTPIFFEGDSLNNILSGMTFISGSVDAKGEDGKIMLAYSGRKVNTEGTAATIEFKVLKPGTHVIKYSSVIYMHTEENPDKPSEPNEIRTDLPVPSSQFTITSKVNPTGLEIYDGTTKIADNTSGIGGFGINKGATKQLTAKLLPEGATGKVIWNAQATTSPEGKAPVTVDQNGNIKANAKGSSIVSATIEGTKISASCYVNVSVPLTGVTVKEGTKVVTSKTINVGNSVTLKAEKIPGDTDDTRAIEWRSEDETKVRIEGEKTADAFLGETATITAVAPTTTPVKVTAKCGSFTHDILITVTNNLNKIVFDKQSVGIDKDAGETATVTATKDPLDTTDTGAIEWNIANSDIAELSPATATAGEGNKTSTVTVSGKANGTTKLIATVTKADGTKVTAEIPVKVDAHISSIKITDTDNTTEFANDALDLEKGKSKTLGIKYSPNSFCDERTITWETSNADVVSVENGVITAKKVGTATIKATSVNGKTHSITVTVPEVAADTLTINGEDTINLIRNDENEKTKKLTVTLGPNNTTDTIEWVSSDPSKVTVDQEGNITAVAVTENVPVTITAKAKTAQGTDRGIEDTITVNVTADLESITLDKANLKLKTDEVSSALVVTKNPTDASVDVADVKWESLNPEVATVDENGVVTASSDKPGTAVIRATLGGKPATCEVTVVAPLTSVEIVDKDTELELKRKQNSKLAVTLKPDYATDVTKTPVWTSSDENVATVDENGVVTAKGAGTATITVNYGKEKDKDGNEIGTQDMTSSRVVKVTEVHASDMEFVTEIPLINRKESQTIKLSFTTADGSDEEITDDITFVSSDPNVLIVDENGKVTGVKKGKATVTVTCRNPETGAEIIKTMAIEVREIPITSLELTAENTTLEEGDTVQINVGCNPKNTTDDKIFVYETSNASIATVSSTGVVTAKKAGDVVITVTAQNGVKSQIRLTIKEKPVAQPVQGVAGAPAAAPAVEGLTNSPHTGDMNIVALSVMMVVSLAGIVLVIKKK